MKTQMKKAFSLLEMSIVLLVISLILSVFISFGSAIYDTSKQQSTKSQLQNIKNSLTSYIAIRGKLPLSDTNNDGIGDSAGFGTLPYLDLGVQSLDAYGMVYQYDVSDNIISTNDANVCRQLANVYLEKDDINNTTFYPQMLDESNNSKYVVAAVVFSKGADKTLSGNNAVANRKYEMALNRYDKDNRDDIMLEISALELLSAVCDLDEADIGSDITLEASGNRVYYARSDNPLNCVRLNNGRRVTVSEGQSITFYHRSDNNCDGNSISKTYLELRGIDVDPKDYFLYAVHTSGGGQPAPTIQDN